MQRGRAAGESVTELGERRRAGAAQRCMRGRGVARTLITEGLLRA